MCKFCGLYYSDRGIKSHEESCQHRALYEWLERQSVDPEETVGSLPWSGEPPEGPYPDAVQGAGTRPEGATPDDPTPDEAVTDGGEGLGLTGPPSGDTDDVDDDTDVEESTRDTEDCPRCGTDLEATEDEIAAAENPRCGDCGTELRVVDE